MQPLLKSHKMNSVRRTQVGVKLFSVAEAILTERTAI
jgi:hypothetical protein